MIEQKANEVLGLVADCLHIKENSIEAKAGYLDAEEELVNIYKFTSIFSAE